MEFTLDQLKEIVRKETENALTEKKKNKKSKWQRSVSKDIEKKGHEGIFSNWCKDQGFDGVNQSCVNHAYQTGAPWKRRATLAVTFSRGKGGAPSLKYPVSEGTVTEGRLSPEYFPDQPPQYYSINDWAIENILYNDAYSEMKERIQSSQSSSDAQEFLSMLMADPATQQLELQTRPGNVSPDLVIKAAVHGPDLGMGEIGEVEETEQEIIQRMTHERGPVPEEMEDEIEALMWAHGAKPTIVTESILSPDQTRRLIREEHDVLQEKRASKSIGRPYKGSRRGKTESQAQQMSAGIALGARRKYGKKRAIKRLRGAPKSMADMSLKDLVKLATIRRGSEVPDSTKKGHKRAALPGHIRKKKRKK